MLAHYLRHDFLFTHSAGCTYPYVQRSVGNESHSENDARIRFLSRADLYITEWWWSPCV